MLNLEYAEYSTEGIRATNQDAVFAKTFGKNAAGLKAVFAIADGMGGMAAGNIASKIAINKLKRILLEDLNRNEPQIKNNIREFISDLYSKINDSIIANSLQFPEREGMGTTLTVVFIFSMEKIYVANVGDSRAYTVHEDELVQITNDHDVLTDSKIKGISTDYLLDTGMYDNALTRSLGDIDYTDVDIFGPLYLKKRESILLSSDGFHRFISENEILNGFFSGNDLFTIIKEIANQALNNGSNDNISVIGARFSDSSKEIAKNFISRKTKKKSGLIILLSILVFLLVYVSYLTYKEYNRNNKNNVIYETEIFKHDTLLQKRKFGKIPSSIKSQKTIKSGINRLNSSINKICQALNIPYPSIPKLNMRVDLKKKLLFINSDTINISKIKIKASVNKVLSSMLKRNGSIPWAIVSKVQNAGKKNKGKIDSLDLIIKSNLPSSFKNELSQNEENKIISFVIMSNSCKINIDAPLIIRVDAPKFKELLDIVQEHKTHIKIETGKSNES